jgi:RHS repeat-associated protein
LGNMSTQSTDAVGRIVTVADPLCNTVNFQYNSLNLLTQSTDPQGHNVSLTYDGNGNLLTLTDPLNHTTSYTYDSMDRAVTRTDPLKRQQKFTYDANGNLASSTDRKGQVTAFTYDGLNRTTLAGFGAAVSGSSTSYQSTIAYTYDAGSRLTQVVDSVGGTITDGYDGLNRLTSETTSLGSITYGYDVASRQTTMQVTGQPQVSYNTYDNANRLTQIAQSGSTVGFGYDNANHRTLLTLPNGVNVSYGYDNDSRLTGITYQFGANTLGNLTYSYNQVSRRMQVGGSFASTALPGVVSSTVYDAANELLNWNGTNLSYDSNGNMLSDGSNVLTWNARDQVATLNNVSLLYDALGRRTKNTAGKSFLYNGENSTQELSATTPTANMWTGGADEFFQRTDSNGTVVPITDPLGSVLAFVDGSGNLTAQYSYDPFGNTTASGTASSNRSQYTGRENEGNGLYFLRARYYSSLLGRFISEDPLGFDGGNFNLYG